VLVALFGAFSILLPRAARGAFEFATG